MKKFLSLVLALVMTMSLVTISAGAKDFTDDEKITYDEAVNVISEIGVVSGYEDGSFNPQGALTRGAAAKIICNMILGPTTAAELRADTAPFKDVPTNHTFAGYIAYCAKEGIISGYADGSFRPSGTLTGYAFMKMLLGALGYDASIEGYTGANWSINVAKQAINVGLNKSLQGDFNGVKAVNREEACLYAFNTLKADLVEYDTTISTTINGQTVTIGNSQAKAMEWLNSASRQKNIKDDKYIQFAEQYFNKLYLTEDVDVFGRPDREWEYKGKEIGTYVNYDLLVAEYTEKVTGKDLYDLLGKSTIEDYDTAVYIDGVDDVDINGEIFNETAMNKNNKKGVGATGDGVLTQVFVDDDSDVKEITIAIINTYLAIADADYSSKKDSVTFDVYALEKVGGEYVKNNDRDDPKDEPLTVSGEDFDIESVEEDDAYLVNVADGEIQFMTPAEIIEDTEISSFKKESNVTVDGTKYDFADTALYDAEVMEFYTGTGGDTVNLKDLTYNIYLDQYGFLIGLEEVEAAKNYVFVTGVDTNASYLSNKTADAAAIFLDGTMEVIEVDMTKSTGTEKMTDADTEGKALVNTWYTYTVSKDGVYTLKIVADKIDKAEKVKTAQYHGVGEMDIDKKHVSLPGADSGSFSKVYGNDASIYLTAELKQIKIPGGAKVGVIDDVDNVTTGVKNANLTTWTEETAKTESDKSDSAAHGVYTLYKDNGYVIAAVVVGEDDAASKNLVYAHEDDIEWESYDKSADEWTWTRMVITDGEEVEIKEVGDSLTYLNKMSEGNWYQVKYNAKGEVINVLDADEWDLKTVNDAGEGEYVTDIKNVEPSINEYDTVLYTQPFDDDTPSLKGSTLFVSTTDKEGFFVAEDAKVVLIQTNDRKKTTTYEVGVDALEDMIDDLNEKDLPSGKTGYNYTVSAILEDGAATVVIIEDRNDATGNKGEKPVSPVNDDIVVDITDGVITVTVEEGAEAGTDDIAAAIVHALNADGYDAVKVQVTEGKVSGATATKNSIEYIFVMGE